METTKKKELYVYKIRRPDGLYYSRAKPDVRPRVLNFSTYGKTWSRLQDCKNAWRQHPRLLEDCRIVKFKIEEVEQLEWTPRRS